jgi:hypothetical protein
LDLFQIFVSSFYHRPIIIVGFGQVGKTTLHKTLIKHPQIAILSGAKESPYFSKTAALIYDIEFSQRSEYLTRKLAVSKDRFFNTIRRLGFEATIGPHYGIGGVLKALIFMGEISFGKRHWCLQTFPEEIEYQCILGLYPQAKFIYLTRNPINAIYDQMNKKINKGVKPDFTVHATKWAQSIKRFRYLTEAANAVHVPFEAFKTSPETTINMIQEFIGVRNQPQLFKHTEKIFSRPSSQKNIATTPGNTLLNISPVGSCQDIFNSWPEEYRIEFRKTCTAAMTELGYQLPE